MTAKTDLPRRVFTGSGDVVSGFPTGFFNGGDDMPSVKISQGAVQGFVTPLSNLVSAYNGLKRYKVRRGDTFSSIASQFSVSVDTIRSANPGIASPLRVGQELLILPVSGILYNLQEGDVLKVLATKYQINVELIKQFNPDYQKIFSDGYGSIILPYAKPLKKIAFAGTRSNDWPDLRGYFAVPAQGLNVGELHEVNAVDIANACGTPVIAAQDGLVIPDETFGDGASGWNNGYGTFVLLEHSNGTRTRYAHLAKSEMHLGDYVSEGQEIGRMGNTGNAHGPAGCYVHFEVYGAKNPFATK